jgi:hypothetical protein
MPMQPSSKRRQRQTGKTKPMTVGKGTGYNRPVTPGKNPRPVSDKPSEASKLRAAKKSTSSGKGAGRAPSVDSRAQRSKVSTAKVTSSESRPSGGTAKVTTGAGKSGGGAPLKAAAKAVAKRVPHVAAAAEGLQAKNTADGTLKGKPTGPQKGPNPTPGKTKSEQFDNAFREARKAGQKTFTWNGKRYTTQIK